MSEPLVTYVNLPGDPGYGIAVAVIPGEFATRVQGLYEAADLEEGKTKALNPAEAEYLLGLHVPVLGGSIQITNNSVAVPVPDFARKQTVERLGCVINHLECTLSVL